MNSNETILQKLEDMAEHQKARDAEIEARQKERHEALEARITNIDTEVKDIRKDNADMKVHQTKLEGDLQRSEAFRHSGRY